MAPIEPATIKYLSELAAESFKRQVELDESVWRSLPFFGAVLALAASIIGRGSADAPPLAWSLYALSTHAALGLATLSFAWALRWFWVVVKARDYEYPSTDAQVRTYAEQMTEFHRASGLAGTELDEKVVEEMRLFMIEQYGSAARTNFAHNAEKMKARSQVLLFMMIGFVLAFVYEGIIFGHNAVNGGPSHWSDAHDQSSDMPPNAGRTATAGTVDRNDAGATGATEAPHTHGGRGVSEDQSSPSNQGETVTDTPTPSPTPTPSSAPARPTPPPPQILRKNDDTPIEKK